MARPRRYGNIEPLWAVSPDEYDFEPLARKAREAMELLAVADRLAR